MAGTATLLVGTNGVEHLVAARLSGWALVPVEKRVGFDGHLDLVARKLTKALLKLRLVGRRRPIEMMHVSSALRARHNITNHFRGSWIDTSGQQGRDSYTSSVERASART